MRLIKLIYWYVLEGFTSRKLNKLKSFENYSFDIDTDQIIRRKECDLNSELDYRRRELIKYL